MGTAAVATYGRTKPADNPVRLAWLIWLGALRYVGRLASLRQLANDSGPKRPHATKTHTAR